TEPFTGLNASCPTREATIPRKALAAWGAQHPQAAKAFLGVVASRVGQEAFNPVKGSVPARIDVSLDGFDDMVKGAAADFDEAARGEARLLPGYASLTTFEYQKEVNPSLLVFAVGGARARLLDPDNV